VIGIIKSVVDFLLYPMNIFWILIALYVVSGIKKYKHQNKFLYVSLIWLFVTGTRWIPDLMINGLEKQYRAFVVDEEVMNDTVYIHVLGGGGHNDLMISPQERLSQTSLARMSEGIRIYREVKGSKLIFSGYSSTSNVTQAALTRDAAIAMGVPQEDMVIMETPATTEEEAKAYRSAFGDSGAKLIVVTSDVHMPRAMYLFRKQGLDPIAAPADHILKRHYMKSDASMLEGHSAFSLSAGEYWWKSHRSNFDKFYAAMHEYIGILWAK
jgi:uncharacterized SAM-binding protein YcdF (DUF218 family)